MRQFYAEQMKSSNLEDIAFGISRLIFFPTFTALLINERTYRIISRKFTAIRLGISKENLALDLAWTSVVLICSANFNAKLPAMLSHECSKTNVTWHLYRFPQI